MLTQGEDVEVHALRQRGGRSRRSPAIWAEIRRPFVPTSAGNANLGGGRTGFTTAPGQGSMPLDNFTG